MYAESVLEGKGDVSDNALSGSDSDSYSPGNKSDSDLSVDSGKVKKTKAGKQVLQVSSLAGKRQRQASSSDKEM